MTFGTLLATIQDYKGAGIPHLEPLTTLLNDAFGDWLTSQGVSHLMMLGDNTLCLNVRGGLKHSIPAEGIEFILPISRDFTGRSGREPRGNSGCAQILHFRWRWGLCLGYSGRLHGGVDTSRTGVGTARRWVFLA